MSAGNGRQEGGDGAARPWIAGPIKRELEQQIEWIAGLLSSGRADAARQALERLKPKAARALERAWLEGARAPDRAGRARHRELDPVGLYYLGRSAER